MDILKTFPRFRAKASVPIVPSCQGEAYPQLADDLAVLDRVVGPAFTTFDTEALREQNRYRLQQVTVIIGAALVAGLGGLQATFPDERWPGLVLAALGTGLALSSRWAREDRSLERYLGARSRAERLRGLHFEYLSATGPYSGAGREAALRAAVRAVEDGREPV